MTMQTQKVNPIKKCLKKHLLHLKVSVRKVHNILKQFLKYESTIFPLPTAGNKASVKRSYFFGS